MFLWVANFRGLTAGFARLPTLSRTFISGYTCLTKNTGFFTRGGIYPYLLYPTHVFFISFFFYATVRLILDVVPFTEPTQSNTKHSVDLPTMHSHPFNAMSPCICNAICHCMSCHMHNECYMDNTIHTTYRYHGQSHHLHMTSINHFIHINLSCKHISTFTFNMPFYDQTMTHTSNPCNGHCT